MAQAVFDIAILDTSIASAINDTCKNLCEGLVSEQAFADLMDHAALFPLSLTPFFCFEIPLHEEKQIADFLFCISDPAALNNLFNGQEFADGLIARNFEYNKLQNFAGLWQSGDPGWSDIKNIWLEFDFADIKQGSSKPSFFYAPEKKMNSLRKVHLTATFFETILNQTIKKDTAKKLLYVLANMPKPAWVSQIGKMAARSDASLRLFIQHVAKDGAEELLKVVGYRYVQDEKLANMLQNCCKFSDQVDVDIDIDEFGQVGPAVGLECSFNHIKGALTFLDHLYAIGICNLNKYEALQRFLQKMHKKDGLTYQPFLAHFKLAYSPDATLKAKVYIGYASTRQAASIIRTQNL